MDSKNKNFDDIRRLSQSIEIKNKILEKYLNYFNKEEIKFINNSIKYRNKFDNEIINQNPNLELYINGFNSINNTLNGFIEYLKESNLYISENNMKKSELKQIIKEEIRSVLEEQDPSQTALYAIAKEMGVEPTTGSSKNKFIVEKLPNYSMLPDLRKDIDYKQRLSVDLPSIDGGISTSALYSKEDVKNWMDKFRETFNEAPKFEVSGKEVKVTNPKFIERQGMSKKAMGRFGTQGD